MSETATTLVRGIEWYAIPGREDEEDCQCGRCGSSCFFDECEWCGGEGEREVDDDEEMGFYVRQCDRCRGSRGSWRCGGSRDWCEANPLAGREGIESTATRRPR
jgi:hypothetical protein